MRLQVRYFASLREALGSGEAVEVAPGSTVADLRRMLLARGARYAEVLSSPRTVRCAVNQAMCDDETALLPEGAEVAFFPPVTGG